MSNGSRVDDVHELMRRLFGGGALVGLLVSHGAMAHAQPRAPYPAPGNPQAQPPYLPTPSGQTPPHLAPGSGAYLPYSTPPPGQYPPYLVPPPSSPPPPASPPPPPPPPPKRDEGRQTLLVASGFSGAFGLTGSRIAVDQGSEWRTYGAGVGGSGAGTVALGPLSVLSRGSLHLGGGGGGLEGAVALESYAGLGVPVGNVMQIFLGIGLNGRGLKNDEIDATTITIPAGVLGLQLAVDGFGLVLGGTGGLVARTDYAPGDELQGRRFFRRTGMRGGYGGTAAIFTPWFAAHGSMVRLAMDEPVTAVDGAACLHIGAFAACGFGQYWRSPATDARGVTQIVPTTQLGITIGIGAAGVTGTSF